MGKGKNKKSKSKCTTTVAATLDLPIPVITPIVIQDPTIFKNMIGSLDGFSNLQTYFPTLEWFTKDSTPLSLQHGLAASPNEPIGPSHTKITHLLDPVQYMKGKYSFPQHLTLPGLQDTWTAVTDKLQCEENQAYVDTVASASLSCLRETGKSPHFALFYGAVCAKADTYLYNLNDDYLSFRNEHWFKENIEKGLFNVKVFSKESGKFLEGSEAEEVLNLPDSLLGGESSYDRKSEASRQSSSDNTSIRSASRQNETSENSHCEEVVEEFHSLALIDETTDCKTLTPILEENLDSLRSSPTEHLIENMNLSDLVSVTSLKTSCSSPKSILRFSPSNHTMGAGKSISDSIDQNDDDILYNIFAEFKDMPVILIMTEKMTASMESLTNISDRSPDSHWIAWLFQIIAALLQAHKAIELYHNDLHSNNILWVDTDEEFLWYKSKSGMWRVPTYGKIFRIIDFGRSIYKLSTGKLVISDDLFPGNDAEGQYNFAHIRDQSCPAIIPNPAFDLVRLGHSLLDYLFPEEPEPKKGGGVMNIDSPHSPTKLDKTSREIRNWKIMETESPLYNLLWNWIVDDFGKNTLRDEDGTERFPGIDLYYHIAQHCLHSAIPKDQLDKEIFAEFRWNNGQVPEGTHVYPLGV